MMPQQGVTPNPVVHVSPLPMHSSHLSPVPEPGLMLQVCDGTQQSMLAVHSAESGQQFWHVPSWHVFPSQQGALLHPVAHVSPMPTHPWHESPDPPAFK